MTPTEPPPTTDTGIGPAGVFVVRAWREHGNLRARIRYVHDVHERSETETTFMTADPATVQEHLTIWLDAIRSTGQ